MTVLAIGLSCVDILISMTYTCSLLKRFVQRETWKENTPMLKLSLNQISLFEFFLSLSINRYQRGFIFQARKHLEIWSRSLLRNAGIN